MNTLEYIGIHTDGRSDLDKYILNSLSVYIKGVAFDMVGPVTRITLAKAMGTDRQRISRICKTLKINDVFDNV